MNVVGANYNTIKNQLEEFDYRDLRNMVLLSLTWMPLSDKVIKTFRIVGNNGFTKEQLIEFLISNVQDCDFENKQKINVI